MKVEEINPISFQIPNREAFAFNLYKKDFGITIESLSGKSVLEIGCGTDVEFLRYCLRHGINITGMDLELPNDTMDELIKSHFVQGDISHLPFVKNNFDLILIRALPQDTSLAEIKAILPLLVSGGEIKITPFFPETNIAHKKLIDDIMTAQDELNFKVSLKRVEMQQQGKERFPRYSLTIKLGKQ